MKLLKLLCFAISSFYTFSSLAQGLGQYDQYGWTIIEPSEDSRIVYVSNSEGDDDNNGLSAQTPKKTITGGDELIRDGFPDHLLLKRGDTFINESLGRWKNGRSKTEPLVISYYGDSGVRPQVIINESFIHNAAHPRSHVAVVGLDFYKPTSDPTSEDFDNTGSIYGIAVFPGIAGAENWLIEDCKFRYCWFAAQGRVEEEVVGFLKNLYFRRNMISRSWDHNSTSAHTTRTQGLFVHAIENLYIEENVFDHCGWNDEIEGALANQYNHNIYIQTSCFGNINVFGNILMRGSAQGLQLRSGGIARHNVMINNAIGMNVGYFTPPDYNTEHTLVADNVVTDGRPQVPNDTENPQTGAIWGIWRMTIENVSIQDNISANILDNRGGNIFPFKDFENDDPNALGGGNIGWNWVNNDFPEGGDYPDASRNIASYTAHKEWGESNALEVYSQLHLNRPLKTYTLEYSAYDYLNYIREGFGKSSDIVSDYTFTDGDVEIPTPLQVKDLDKILVYPNPVSDLLKIDQRLVGSQFQLYSVTGELQAKGTITLSGIDFSSLSNGLYLLEINPTDQQAQVIQIIKSEK